MRSDVRLHPVEVDLLCTFAEVEPPFPLEIPSTGTTAAERAMMFRGAREQLTARGLADEGGPLGVADDFVHLLRFGTGALDLTVVTQDVTVGAVVLADRDEAVICVQRDDDPYQTVLLRLFSLDDAVDELMRIVPRLDAAQTTPFTLPRKALQAAFDAMLANLPDDGAPPADQRPPQEVEELLARHGVDDRVSLRMVQHLQPVLGNGQAGVARRRLNVTGEWERAGEEVRWLDTPRGRYRLAGGDDGDWMSVNPFGPDETRSAIRQLAALLRG